MASDKAMALKPTPIRVSTITAVGGVNTSINLDLLFTHLRIVDAKSADDGFVFVSHKKKRDDELAFACCSPHFLSPADAGDASDTIVLFRGVKPPNKQQKRAEARENKRKVGRVVARKKNGSFDNQSTAIYMTASTYLNVKVFKNGKVQITGIKDPDQGYRAIDGLIEELRRIHSDVADDIIADASAMCNVNYRLCMVNSDFLLGVEIRRNVLCEEFAAAGFDVTFEPCIYPGVKIGYYYNDAPGYEARGKCKCSAQCVGRGRGNGDCDCRKVTIAAFQSGCVIITGAQAVQQVHDARAFVVDLVGKILQRVAKPVVLPADGRVGTLSVLSVQ